MVPRLAAARAARLDGGPGRPLSVRRLWRADRPRGPRLRAGDPDAVDPRHLLVRRQPQGLGTRRCCTSWRTCGSATASRRTSGATCGSARATRAGTSSSTPRRRGSSPTTRWTIRTTRATTRWRSSCARPMRTPTSGATTPVRSPRPTAGPTPVQPQRLPRRRARALRAAAGGGRRDVRAHRARVGRPLPRRRGEHRGLHRARLAGRPSRPAGFLRAWLYGETTPPMPGHPDWTADPVVETPPSAKRAPGRMPRR